MGEIDLGALIERYNEAWNAHDLDAIHAAHAPGIVFENFTVGERVEAQTPCASTSRRSSATGPTSASAAAASTSPTAS